MSDLEYLAPQYRERVRKWYSRRVKWARTLEEYRNRLRAQSDMIADQLRAVDAAIEQRDAAALAPESAT